MLVQVTVVDSDIESNCALIPCACKCSGMLLPPSAGTTGAQVIRDPSIRAIKIIETREFVLRMASPRFHPVIVAHLSLTASNPPIGGLE